MRDAGQSVNPWGVQHAASSGRVSGTRNSDVRVDNQTSRRRLPMNVTGDSRSIEDGGVLPDAFVKAWR